MALIMVNEEDLYHFENVEDAFLWIELNPTDESIVMMGEGHDTEIVMHYIKENYPIEVR